MSAPPRAAVPPAPTETGTTAVLAGLRVALHVTFAALLTVGLARALADRSPEASSGPFPATTLVLLTAALAGVYLAGTVLERRRWARGDDVGRGPAVAWLAWQGDYGMAVFLGIWGMFVISGVDNVLKPYLISRGGNLPLVVVLLGVFGGILAFGFMGLFLGPTLLAVAYSLLGDWLIKEVPQMPAHESTQLPGESRESVGP